jgi:hypothetical protein
MQEKVTEYRQNEDGSLTLVNETTIEMVPAAEFIAAKEAKLLKMYEQLEELKAANGAAE